MRIGLHLTDRCQLDCTHCLRDPGRHAIDLELEVVDRVLADAARLGVSRVSLTGGEPTLHPRFPEVLDAIAAHGMEWDMISNGGRFERLAEWLHEVPARRESLKSISLSLDGATDDTHDAIRGRGQRREVLGAMTVCVAHSIPFSTTTALHARNVSEIEAIAEEASALGASPVRFAMTQATGTDLDGTLRLDPAEWDDAKRRILALAPRLPVRLSAGWPGDSVAECDPIRGTTLHVDHHGSLTLCCSHSQVPGDVGDRTIAGDVRGGLAAPLARLDRIRERIGSELVAERSREDAWARFECNSCLRLHGRPHWTDSPESAGDRAVRERWRGAWSRDVSRHKRLPLAR